MLQGYVENPMIQETETPSEDIGRAYVFGWEMTEAEREERRKRTLEKLKGEGEDE